MSRHDTHDMTCRRVLDLVRREGEVILRFLSPGGLPLYDRYVAHAGYCGAAQFAQIGWIPTADTASCPVLRCLPKFPEEP